MDREQEEVQFLGFFGILKESVNIILSQRRIFARITGALILPLSLIFLAHVVISETIYGEIFCNEVRLLHTRIGTPTYTKLTDILASEYTAFFAFTVVYYVFLLVLSLLSTSAVVYTIACIYTAKEFTFKKVMSVVPKVWKRLMLTFLWSSVVVCGYHIIALPALCFWAVFVSIEDMSFLFLLILYLVGLVYIGILWHLANVVSVLENLYGIQAMIKSKTLIEGKTMVAGTFYLLMNAGFLMIQEAMIVTGAKEATASPAIKVGYWFLCLLVMVALILFGLVIQTIIYFVCKSYHHESIDKSSLADHLEVYLEEYEPLKDMDLLLEQTHV